MKIYILGERCEGYGGIEIFGVYSTLEKALEAIPYIEEPLSEIDVQELEIDPENTGGKCEVIYYFNIFPDGLKEGGSYRKKPKVPRECYKFNPDHGKYSAKYIGFGLTHEEAEMNAEKCKAESEKP